MRLFLGGVLRPRLWGVRVARTAYSYPLIHHNQETFAMHFLTFTLIALVCLIHVYIFLLETVLFRSRGFKVFGIAAHEVQARAAAMSNQGVYNAFLAAALLLGLVWPDAAIARAFANFGLGCVAVAGVWGAVTVMRRILWVQTVPAALALAALHGLG